MQRWRNIGNTKFTHAHATLNWLCTMLSNLKIKNPSFPSVHVWTSLSKNRKTYLSSVDVTRVSIGGDEKKNLEMGMIEHEPKLFIHTEQRSPL